MIGAVIVAAVGGLLVGSFANVVIYRVPAHESIVSPGSRCPACRTPIEPRDNIPVLSWIVLRGRCRSCGVSISPRYPVVELLTAGLFALTAARLDPLELLAYLPLVWVLIVLSGIDIDHKLLPNRVVFPSLVAFIVLLLPVALAGPGLGAWIRALLGGAAAFVGLLLVALIYPRGMGMGDVKLAALLGAALAYISWSVLYVGFFLAFLAGALGGILMIAARRGGMKSEIPFGPYLALGTLLGIFWGEPIARAWLG